MRTLKWVVLPVLGILVLVSRLTWRIDAQSPSKPYWQPLDIEEAEILAYLTPFGVDRRKRGLDVIVDTTDAGCYQGGFIGIELISTKTFARGGLEDHEYVAVNLDTAEVYDPIPIPAQQLRSTELFSVANIMRKAHHIDGKVLELYGSIQPELKGPPPCK